MAALSCVLMLVSYFPYLTYAVPAVAARVASAALRSFFMRIAPFSDIYATARFKNSNRLNFGDFLLKRAVCTGTIYGLLFSSFSSSAAF